MESAPVKVSVKMPVTFTRPVAKPAIRWSDQSNGTTASQEKNGSKKKWIWIAAAAGGGAAAFFLLKKDPVPVITVGPPTVGPLQIGVR